MNFKTIEEANRWIGEHFKVSEARIDITLKTRLAHGLMVSRKLIYTPSEVVEKQEGQCQDLSRFGYEVAKILGKGPKYIIISHERSVERLWTADYVHWVVAYKEGNSWFVYADSRNPGRIFGPYSRIDEFAKEYREMYSEKGTGQYIILNDMEWN